MKSMVLRHVLAGACVVLAVTLAAPVMAQDTTAGGYKIGIVNMKEVFQGYNRQKAEYENLKKAQQAAQGEIDKISDKINADKKRYEERKATMSRDEREQMELQISKDFSNYQAEFKKLQDDIDLKERKLLKDLFQEITEAVQLVGQSENYHLILEAGSDGNNAVLYYATPLNLTQKVVEHLNANTR